MQGDCTMIRQYFLGRIIITIKKTRGRGNKTKLRARTHSKQVIYSPLFLLQVQTFVALQSSKFQARQLSLGEIITNMQTTFLKSNDVKIEPFLFLSGCCYTWTHLLEAALRLCSPKHRLVGEELF